MSPKEFKLFSIFGGGGCNETFPNIFYPPQLRTPFNWLLINLSATDLCVALLGNPVLAYNAFHRTWKLSETACQLNAFGMTFLGMERGFYIFTYTLYVCIDQYYIKYIHYTHLRTLRVVKRSKRAKVF